MHKLLDTCFIAATYKRQKCDDCGWKPYSTEIQQGWNTPPSSHEEEDEESLSTSFPTLKHEGLTQHVKHKFQLIKQAESLDEEEAPQIVMPSTSYGRRGNPGYMRIIIRHRSKEASPYPNRKRYLLH